MVLLELVMLLLLMSGCVGIIHAVAVVVDSHEFNLRFLCLTATGVARKAG